MATVKIINSRLRYSSMESVSLSVYVHNSFTPEISANLTVDIFDNSGLIGSATFNSSEIPGVFISDIENQIGTLPPEEYFLMIKESGNIIGSFSLIKRGDLARSEIFSLENRRTETVYSDSEIPHRNIVPGSVEKLLIKRKNYADNSFENPVEQGYVGFSYRSTSVRSDVVLSTPSIPDVLDSVSANYGETFEDLSWIKLDFTEDFEDNSWNISSDFIEPFEDSSWT